MQELIEKILYSNKEESRKAKQQIEKLNDYDDQGKLYSLFLDNVKNFKESSNYQGIANFIYAAKWHIFYCKEKDYDIWANFLLHHVISASGLVRNAVVKVFPNLLCSFRFSNSFYSKPNQKDLELIKKYGQLADRVEDLLADYSEEKYNSYKDVSDLPVSVFKSLNYLWTDLNYFMRGDKILEYYYIHLKQEDNNEDYINKEQLALLVDFESFLHLNNIKFKIEEIIDIIYQEKTHESLKIALSYICAQASLSAENMSKALEYINSLWYIFPHFDLDGQAPLDLIKKKKYE
jgi:hypothetical protein